jgi:hypothetical protein
MAMLCFDAAVIILVTTHGCVDYASI